MLIRCCCSAWGHNPLLAQQVTPKPSGVCLAAMLLHLRHACKSCGRESKNPVPHSRSGTLSPVPQGLVSTLSDLPPAPAILIEKFSSLTAGLDCVRDSAASGGVSAWQQGAELLGRLQGHWG